MILLLESNTYSFYDNYLISTPKVGEFYSISSQITTQTTYHECLIGMVTIFLDNEVVHYERRVYNLYDMIGDIGGIYQVLFTLFSFFLSMYTLKLYGFQMVHGVFNSQSKNKVTPLKQANSKATTNHNTRHSRYKRMARRATAFNQRHYQSSKNQNEEQQDKSENHNSSIAPRVIKIDNNEEEI